MVKGKRKYIQLEIFRQTVEEKAEEDSGRRIMYELTIREAALTDEEEAKLKDILREAAEKANSFLGWQ